MAFFSRPAGHGSQASAFAEKSTGQAWDRDKPQLSLCPLSSGSIANRISPGMDLDPHADALAEVARSLAPLVQSGRLARAGADRVTKALRAELRHTDELARTLVAVLDAVVMAVDRGQLELYRQGVRECFHLETLLRVVPELAAHSQRNAQDALRLAIAAVPAAGVVSVGARAAFEGVPRRRYVVIDVDLVRAFLLRRRPVLSR